MCKAFKKCCQLLHHETRMHVPSPAFEAFVGCRLLQEAYILLFSVLITQMAIAYYQEDENH